ncbi:unnamed protein product [Symbiodinium sp. CCMP2592]|nr:unnamed protein product [Symbiodinium sp. CCMP2592]
MAMWGRGGRGDLDGEDRWSTGGGDTGLDDLVGFGDMRGGAGGRGGDLGWGASDLAVGPGGRGFGAPAFHRGSGAGLGGLGGFGGVHFAEAESQDEEWWGGWEAEDEGELGEWKWAMVVVKEGEHKKKTGIVTVKWKSSRTTWDLPPRTYVRNATRRHSRSKGLYSGCGPMKMITDVRSPWDSTRLSCRLSAS